MEKRISYTEFQSAKSVAKACDPIIRKRDALKKKVEGLVEEYRGYQKQIDALEAGIVQVIGFHVEDLVKKVIETTGTDANGKDIKVTKYLPTERVSYDADKKQYVITLPDPEPAEAATGSEEIFQ